MRFARWAGCHCLVSGAIGFANALCPLGGLPLFGKWRDWLCQYALFIG